MRKCFKCGYVRTREDDDSVPSAQCPQCGETYGKQETYYIAKKLAEEDARRKQAEEEAKQRARDEALRKNEEEAKRESERETRIEELIRAEKLCPLCREEVPSFVIEERKYCKACARKIVKSSVTLTTTDQVEGYKIKRYIDIDSVEIVIETETHPDPPEDVSDSGGTRSSSLEQKFQEAKTLALNKLRYKALQKDGNAVIGVKLDYTPISKGMTGLVVSGTIVRVEPSDLA